MPAVCYKGVMMVDNGTLCGYPVGRLLGPYRRGMGDRRCLDEVAGW